MRPCLPLGCIDFFLFLPTSLPSLYLFPFCRLYHLLSSSKVYPLLSPAMQIGHQKKKYQTLKIFFASPCPLNIFKPLESDLEEHKGWLQWAEHTAQSEHLASTMEDNAMKIAGMIHVWALELVLVIACQGDSGCLVLANGSTSTALTTFGPGHCTAVATGAAHEFPLPSLPPWQKMIGSWLHISFTSPGWAGWEGTSS